MTDAEGRSDERVAKTGVSAKKQVLLAGDVSAGKSTYLAVLEQALGRTPWAVVRPALTSYANEISEIRRHLQAGYFPPKTDPESGGVLMELNLESGGVSHGHFEIIDVGGELFDQAQQARHADKVRKLQGQLTALAGCLMFIDPGSGVAKARATFNSVKSLVWKESAADRNEVRVSIVVAKADLIPWQRRWRAESSDRWLRASDFKVLLREVETKFPRARAYFSSSIGWHFGMPNVRTVPRPIDLENTADTDKLERHHIERFGARAPTVPLAMYPDPARVVLRGDRNSTTQRCDVEVLDKNSQGVTMPYLRDPDGVSQELLLSSYVGGDVYGNVALLGRRPPESANGRPQGAGVETVKPWNVAEPFLWAALGYPA